MNPLFNRRTLFRFTPIALTSFALATCSRAFSNNQRQSNASLSAESSELALTSSCGDDPTPPQTEGPFYTPDSPERQSLLEPGLSGTPIIITGQVLSSQCDPIAGALVDVWHTNDQGEYDNSGYTFRGHQFTDAGGRYWIETIIPGLYPGRTRHIHVKVQAPQQRVLTTQLYFPDEPANQNDFLFDSQLLMTVEDTGEGTKGAFNFVV